VSYEISKGVLADTERDGHRPAFNRAFAANNIDEDCMVNSLKSVEGKNV
jgi:hypothetical protein